LVLRDFVAEVLGTDAELYLPQAWADDPEQMTTSGVPESVSYQPKRQLALPARC